MYHLTITKGLYRKINLKKYQQQQQKRNCFRTYHHITDLLKLYG